MLLFCFWMLLSLVLWWCLMLESEFQGIKLLTCRSRQLQVWDFQNCNFDAAIFSYCTWKKLLTQVSRQCIDYCVYVVRSVGDECINTHTDKFGMSLFLYPSICICIYTYIYTYTCTCIYIYIHIYKHTHIYTYVYIHTYIHSAHIHIHTNLESEREIPFQIQTHIMRMYTDTCIKHVYKYPRISRGTVTATTRKL